MEDDDDGSIGLPSLNSAALSGPRGSTSALLDLDTQMDSDQEDFDPEISLGSLNTTSDLASNLAGAIASNMIQAAIAGALQPRPPQGPRRERGPRPGAAPRGYRKQSSSELDTDLDLDGEDFEMLDQSELNQLDPFGGGQGSQNRTQGSSFLSNLLGKPQWSPSYRNSLRLSAPRVPRTLIRVEVCSVGLNVYWDAFSLSEWVWRRESVFVLHC